MKITEKQPFFLLPVKGYRGDLKVLDSEGNDMIILSDKEFESQFGASMSDIIKLYLEKLKRDLSEKYSKLTKDYRVVAVLFNKNYDEYYETVKITWTEQIHNRKRGSGISEYAEIPIYIPRYGFDHGATSAIYLSIKTNSKYEIGEKPRIIDLRSSKEPTLTHIIDDQRHKVYRFSETEKPQLIEIVVKIELPTMIEDWAQLGLFAGIVLPLFLILLTFLTHHVPKFSHEILAGIITFIVGLRVFVFHDTVLMRNWKTIHYVLVIWCALVLLGLITWEAFASTSVTTMH
ncbi:MAG: hypothetical protein ACREA7_07905 [Nitrosotalea sp.]